MPEHAQVLWTALPRGRRRDALALAAFASPRLGIGSSAQELRLSDFPPFAAWPDVVRGLSWTARVDGGAPVVLRADDSPLDADLWRHCLRPETRVVPWSFRDPGDRRIRSFPARWLLAELQAFYTALGRSGAALPSWDDARVEDVVKTLGPVVSDESEVRKKLEEELEAAIRARGVVDDGAGPLGLRDPTLDAFQVLRFYERPEDRRARGEPVRPRIAPPDPDFHELLGALGDFPVLLRRLGLVVDLLLPLPRDRLHPTAQRVQLDVTVAGVEVVLPVTGCDASFLPRASGPDLRAGMLDLAGAGDKLDPSPDALYDVACVDTDGAVLKAAAAAGTVGHLRELAARKAGALDERPEASLPALRTAGLAVLRRGRAAALRAALDRQRALAATDPPPELRAEDLVRGYRVEVRDEADGSWRSLHLRTGTYRQVDADGVVLSSEAVDDEGYVKATGATTAGPGADLYVHEAIVRWLGWSLSAPRPGRTIVADPPGASAAQVDKPEVVPGDEVNALRLQARFAAKPASLPRLRFGRRYRVRMTGVDLSGRPLIATPTDDAPASDPVTFLRFEPVPPPTLVPRAAFAEGESLERLAVRSAPDGPLGGTCERHLLPPRATLELVEYHARLDAAFGPNGDPASVFALAARENATLRKSPTAQLIPVPTPGAQPPETGVMLVDGAERLPAPYLPDPAAGGIALRGLPGMTQGLTFGDGLEVVAVPGEEEPALLVPWRGSWPDYEPLRLVLAHPPAGSSGQAPPAWADGVLTVFLPPAATASVRFASFVAGDALELLGVFRWLAADDPDSTAKAQALAGAHWMLSPFRTLALVHAVQHPLAAPALPRLDGLEHPRQAAETAVRLGGEMTLDGAGSGRLDLLATWTDPFDDADPAHEPGEVTRTDAPVATFLREPFWADALSVAPISPADIKRGVKPPPIRHELGDTKHRRIAYRLRATSRFREYFAGPRRDDVAIDGPASTLVDVPSSARPSAPGVVAVLPTFGWEGDERVTKLGATRRRHGGGLRVYLERPWFSSGAGELLAVLLSPPGAPQPQLDAYVSGLGSDPIWPAAAPAVRLEAAHFLGTAPIRPETRAFLAELPGGGPTDAVALVAYAPQYDRTRDLWLCDLELDLRRIPGYWPFLRLALARYQPTSVGSTDLSPVVQAGFTQLAPDRALSLVRAGTAWDVTVRGSGPLAAAGGLMGFVLEAASRADPDDLDWFPASGDGFADPASWVAPTADGDGLRWIRRVPVPPGESGRPLRLAVRELERLPTDPDVQPVGRGIPRPRADRPTVPDRSDSGFMTRVVYADAIRLQ